MENVGIIIDKRLNKNCVGKEGIISTKKSKVKICVIKTDEEIMIANFTRKLL